jgi:hypothetical protein
VVFSEAGEVGNERQSSPASQATLKPQYPR